MQVHFPSSSALLHAEVGPLRLPRARHFHARNEALRRRFKACSAGRGGREKLESPGRCSSRTSRSSSPSASSSSRATPATFAHKTRVVLRYRKSTNVALFRATNDRVCYAFRAAAPLDHDAVKRVLRALGELLPRTPGIDYAAEEPRPAKRRGKKNRP